MNQRPATIYIRTNAPEEFPFRRIEISGALFILSSLIKARSEKIFIPLRSREVPTSIPYIRGDGPTKLSTTLPDQIYLNNISYLRRLETYYTPAVANYKDIRRFFNSLALTYEIMIDDRLNGEVIAWFLRKFRREAGRIGTVRPLRILDYGVGTGLSIRIMRKLSDPFWKDVTLFGCDISPNMVTSARTNGFENLSVCQYSRTAYKSRSFDFVFASFVAHYFADEKPIQEIYRILKPGGLFLFNVRAVAGSGRVDQYARWLQLAGFRLMETAMPKIVEGKAVLILKGVRPAGK